MWKRDTSVSYVRMNMRVGRVILAAHYYKYSMIRVMVSVISWAFVAPLTVGKLRLWWARVQGKLVQSKYGTIIW